MLMVSQEFKDKIKPVNCKFVTGDYEGDRAMFYIARDFQAAIDEHGRKEFGLGSGVYVKYEKLYFPGGMKGKYMTFWKVWAKNSERAAYTEPGHDETLIGEIAIYYDVVPRGERAFKISREDAPDHIDYSVRRASMRATMSIDEGAAYEDFLPGDAAESLHLFSGLAMLVHWTVDHINGQNWGPMGPVVLIEPDHFKTWVPRILHSVSLYEPDENDD